MTIVLETLELFIKDILIVVKVPGKPVTGEKINVELAPEAGMVNWIPLGKIVLETTAPLV